MKRLLLIAVTAGLVAQPADISAQLFYQGIPDAQEYLKFIGGSGVSANGVQVGPYLGQFDESPLAPAFNIYCVDYKHYAKSQKVNVTSLSNGGPLANTRLGDYVAYQKTAYLSSLFHDPAHAGNWGQIHAAIWAISSGVTVGSTGNYLTMANANYATFSTDGWYILSPLNASGGAYDGTGQEFLMRVSVPEPAALLLMATGLLFLAALSRKRLAEVVREEL